MTTPAPIRHTPPTWTVADNIGSFAGRGWRLSGPEGFEVYPDSKRHEAIAEAVRREAAYLCTAPHVCADANCPGNQNRLKLEAFDKLVEAMEHVMHDIDHPNDVMPFHKSTVSLAAQQGAREALALAQQIKVNP